MASYITLCHISYFLIHNSVPSVLSTIWDFSNLFDILVLYFVSNTLQLALLLSNIRIDCLKNQSHLYSTVSIVLNLLHNSVVDNFFFTLDSICVECEYFDYLHVTHVYPVLLLASRSH